MAQFISTQFIRLGGLVFRFDSDLPLALTDNTRPFAIAPCQADIRIRVQLADPAPRLPENLQGQDILMNYYADGSRLYAETRPGLLGPLMITEYTSDFSEVTVYVNEREHPGIVRTVDKVLQLIPVRRYFAQNNRMILHASQIAVGERGILFSAPSGTGKSTQAELWRQNENAQIICNDRTLLSYLDGRCFTYGYPIDGSSPVCSDRQLELGALVILRQGCSNEIQRLSAFRALKNLMGQTVLDAWCPDERQLITQQWMNILQKYPAYLLTCLPDAGAVSTLKHELLREEVI